MSKPAGEAALRREVGLLAAALLVINGTIGTGIFKTPSEVARLSGSLPATFGVWIAGGVFALCGALSLAELGGAIPRSGGMVEFVRRAWGPTPAFLYGWTRQMLLIPAAAGGFAKLSAENLAVIMGWPLNPARDGHVALAFLLPAAALNLAGVKNVARGAVLVTTAKYVGVVAIAALGLTVAAPELVAVPADMGDYRTLAAPTIAGLFAALVAVMWAYDGWADLNDIAGEVKNPSRIVPRALILGTAAIVVVYLLANLGYANALDLEGLRHSTTSSNTVAANTARVALGDVGLRLIAILIVVSCAGCAMSSLLTGPRVLVAMASEGLFIKGLGAVSPRTGVPSRAIIVGTLLAAVYVEWRSFEQLTGAFVVGVMPFYMLAVSAVYVLRATEPDLPRPFRVPGYPITPAIFLAGACALLSGALAELNTTALWAFGAVLAGLPVRWIWLRARG